MEDELKKRNESLKEVARQLSELAHQALAATHQLAQDRPVGNTSFLRVLEATYRRSYGTLDAVVYLSGAPDFGLGNPSMILTRSIVEDGISIEYMLAGDKEKLARQFQDFAYVQGHQDNKFLEDTGLDQQPIVQASIKDIEDNYKKVRQQYKKSGDGSIFRTWSGIDVDGMLRLISNMDLPNFKASDVASFTRSYLSGNRKTHFNPIDLAVYLDERHLHMSYAESAVSALAVGLSVYIRLTTRYIDEISHALNKNLYRNEAKTVIEILEKMNNLDFYDVNLDQLNK
ncbi:MAG: DUF5677 domain-containing protein [Candidatus Saccharibacteria bacterium]